MEIKKRDCMKSTLLQVLLGTWLFYLPLVAKTTTIIIAFSTLFEPNEKAIEKHIKSKLGVANSISLLFSGIPTKEETKEQYFEFLNEISLDLFEPLPLQKKAVTIPSLPWEKEYQMPRILCYYLVTKTRQQEKSIYATLVEQINSSVALSGSHKKIYQGIIDYLFQSAQMNPIMQPIKPMIRLMQSLKKRGYRLVLIGNVPAYAWETFLRDCPQAKIISKLFKPDDIFISGMQGCLAQSEEMYTAILRQNRLDSRKCLVIDIHKKNLDYPRKKGMKSIVANTGPSQFNLFKRSLQTLLEQ